MISPVELRTAELMGANNPTLLESRQMERVRELMGYVRESSRFYAEKLSDIDASKLKTYRDMALLPFTFPSEVQQRRDDFLCVPARNVSRITTLRTSGSTDISKRIAFTDRDLARTLDFFRCGMSGMVGEGERCAIMFSADTPNSIASLLSRALVEIGVKPEIYGYIADAAKVGEALSASGAECLAGIPSEMLALCRDYPNLRPKSVLVTTDYVAESLAYIIEETWKCRTFTHYGMTETGFGGAVQCSAGEEHHIRHSDLLIETVDPTTGEQLPPGVRGEVTVTTFSNEAMPLLRYRTGDISSLTAEPCGCGGVFPRLGRIIGRAANIITLNNDVNLSIEALDEIVYAANGIRGYKAELMERNGRRELLLTVDMGSNRPDGSLKESLSSYLKDSINFNILYKELPTLQGVAKRRIGNISLLDK